MGDAGVIKLLVNGPPPSAEKVACWKFKRYSLELAGQVVRSRLKEWIGEEDYKQVICNIVKSVIGPEITAEMKEHWVIIHFRDIPNRKTAKEAVAALRASLTARKPRGVKIAEFKLKSHKGTLKRIPVDIPTKDLQEAMLKAAELPPNAPLTLRRIKYAGTDFATPMVSFIATDEVLHALVNHCEFKVSYFSEQQGMHREDVEVRMQIVYEKVDLQGLCRQCFGKCSPGTCPKRKSCFKCGSAAHLMKDCQSHLRKCTGCGSANHIVLNCPERRVLVTLTTDVVKQVLAKASYADKVAGQQQAARSQSSNKPVRAPAPSSAGLEVKHESMCDDTATSGKREVITEVDTKLSSSESELRREVAFLKQQNVELNEKLNLILKALKVDAIVINQAPSSGVMLTPTGDQFLPTASSMVAASARSSGLTDLDAAATAVNVSGWQQVAKTAKGKPHLITVPDVQADTSSAGGTASKAVDSADHTRTEVSAAAPAMSTAAPAMSAKSLKAMEKVEKAKKALQAAENARAELKAQEEAAARLSIASVGLGDAKGGLRSGLSKAKPSQS